MKHTQNNRQRLMYLIIVLALLIIVGLVYFLGIKKGKITPFASGENVVMYLDPASGTYNVGSNFTATIKVNTNGALSDGVSSVVSYDGTYLEVVDQDANRSGVQIKSEGSYPQEITNTVSNGKIIFIAGADLNSQVPAPIVGDVKVATITFKALRSINATNVAFFIDPASVDNTMVTYQSNNILSNTTNGSYKINAVVVAAPTADLKIDGGNGPISKNQGESATLSWSSTNATSCTSSGGWSGAKATSGSQSTGSLSSTQSFSLSCSGGGGVVKDTVIVNIIIPGKPQPSVDLKVNDQDGPIDVNSGDSVTLSWSSNNTSSCSASGDWSDTKSTSGSEQIGSLDGGRTYILTCDGEGGSAADSVSVNVSSQVVEESIDTTPIEQPTEQTSTETPTPPTPVATEPSKLIPSTTDQLAKLPANIQPSIPPLSAKKSIELFENVSMKPWTLWFLYAIIPAFLAGGTIYYYLKRKKNKAHNNLS